MTQMNDNMDLASLIHSLVDLMSEVGNMDIVFCADSAGTFNGVSVDHINIMNNGKAIDALSITLKNFEKKDDLESKLDSAGLGIKGIKIENGQVSSVDLSDLPPNIRKSLEGEINNLLNDLGEDNE